MLDLAWCGTAVCLALDAMFGDNQRQPMAEGILPVVEGHPVNRVYTLNGGA